MSILKYKQTGRIGLFDKEENSSKLSQLGNPLEKLHKVIDFAKGFNGLQLFV